jgi:hypothetical protein
MAPKITEYFRPVGWHEFQHYKQRRPPWIKLHTALLENPKFEQLKNHEQLFLVKIWLLYARLDEPIPVSKRFLNRLCSIPTRFVNQSLDSLISLNFIELCDQNASTALAECLPRDRDRVRKERKTPTESKERKSNGESQNRIGSLLPDGWQPNQWDIDYAKSRGLTNEQISDAAESFATHFTTGNGRNKRYTCWSGDGRSAFANWIRRTRSNGACTNGTGGNQREPASVVAATNSVIRRLQQRREFES